jgi:hypothetical protein
MAKDTESERRRVDIVSETEDLLDVETKKRTRERGFAFLSYLPSNEHSRTELVRQFSKRLGNSGDVFGLGSLRTVDHLKLNLLALDQGFIAVAGDRTVMDENVLLSGLFNKTIALGVVKPLDLTDCLIHIFVIPPTNYQKNSDHLSSTPSTEAKNEKLHPNQV